jgi:hypothetical protein
MAPYMDGIWDCHWKKGYNIYRQIVGLETGVVSRKGETMSYFYTQRFPRSIDREREIKHIEKGRYRYELR